MIKIGVKKYSREEILNQLRQHYSKNKDITYTSFKEDKETCSARLIELRFGSW